MSDEPEDDFIKWTRERSNRAPEKPKIERMKNGQFKKGVSANPAGRTPHRERAFLPRQKTRDILEVTEEILEIKTAKGVKKLSAFQIVLLKMRSKAFDGHSPSMYRLLRLHAEALEAHYNAHKAAAEGLDQSEALIVGSADPVSNFMHHHMNRGRKNSRRT